MNLSEPAADASLLAAWTLRLAPFHRPHLHRSLWQLANSAVLFAALWYASYLSLELSYAVTLLLCVPTAFMLIRLFIIQHDCGHGSFFRSNRAANVVGGLLGVLTVTPYRYWKRAHAVHHATAGNLDHRGIGDVDTLTVREYRARSRWGRFGYRMYRHPAILFGVGATVLFLVRHRVVSIAPREWPRERRSILWTNLGIAAFWTGLCLLVGVKAFLLVHIPVIMVAASIGVWLFYVQHQFEQTYWENDREWAFHQAALEGSSYYVLPGLLQWLTGSIGLHQIHHLNARIPNYRLQEVLDAFPELGEGRRLTLRDSLRCASLTLWDESTRRLVSFAEARSIP